MLSTQILFHVVIGCNKINEKTNNIDMYIRTHRNCFLFTVIDEAEITLAIQSDAKSLDRLAERAYCRDYARLAIGSLLNNQPRSRNEAFRLSMVNTNYSLCRSYPAVLVVPNSISDDSIRKLARSNRQYR